MKYLIGLAGGIILLANVVVAHADPSGQYNVTGTNPDGSEYEASVLVSKIGENFSIVYTLSDDTKVQGTAIGDDDLLAIGYSEGSDIGVVLMVRDGDTWKGPWSYLGSDKMGAETWTKE
jgi:hypothetical protein